MSFLSQLNSFQHLQHPSSELLDGHIAANFDNHTTNDDGLNHLIPQGLPNLPNR